MHLEWTLVLSGYDWVNSIASRGIFRHFSDKYKTCRHSRFKILACQMVSAVELMQIRGLPIPNCRRRSVKEELKWCVGPRLVRILLNCEGSPFPIFFLARYVCFEVISSIYKCFSDVVSTVIITLIFRMASFTYFVQIWIWSFTFYLLNKVLNYKALRSIINMSKSLTVSVI